jgi:hypothetical protein
MASSDSRTRTKHRNTELGDRACFCVSCGWARRYYPGVIEPPDECPTCERAVISACPSCDEDILSVMAVECDVCGEALREPEANGVRIHRPKRLPMASPAQASDAASGPGSCQTSPA